MTKQSEPRERRTPASKRSSNGRKLLLNWRPPEVANSYWLKSPNRLLIDSRPIIYFKYSKLLQIHSASIIKDQLADLQSRGFRAAKLSSLKTSEFKECRVEIIVCSAEEALTKEFTSELKSSSLKLHQPSLWINCILCKHGQARGYWLVNFKHSIFNQNWSSNTAINVLSRDTGFTSTGSANPIRLSWLFLQLQVYMYIDH